MKSARRVVTIGKRLIHAGGERATKPEREQGRKPTPISLPIVESDFAELDNGSRVEMVEDPANSHRTKFAVFKNGEVRFVDQVLSGKEILRPLNRESEFIKHVRLSRGAEPHESVPELLWRMNEKILSRCLDMSEDHKFLLACFALSTWFVDSDHMPVAPYIALAGLPGSGKSTVLKILRLLCRRALLTADVTSAAFYRACEKVSPTLLIDETYTAGDKRTLFHLLKIGNSRDVVSLRRDESFKAYGAKAFAWNELPADTALNSRCIIIPMQETNRSNLARPNEPDIVAAADEIQKQLLWYRLESLKTLGNAPKPSDENLAARVGDLHEALVLALGDHAPYRKWLRLCCEDQAKANREPLPPREAAVLNTLYKAIHTVVNYERYPIAQLTSLVKADLKEEGSGMRLNPRAVGAALSSLGITNHRRTNLGYVVDIDRKLQQRIHKLVELYGLDSETYLPHELRCKACELCDPDNDMRSYDLRPVWKISASRTNAAGRVPG